MDGNEIATLPRFFLASQLYHDSVATVHDLVFHGDLMKKLPFWMINLRALMTLGPFGKQFWEAV